MKEIIKAILIILAISAALLLAGRCVNSQANLQNTAENSVKFMQGYILRYNGIHYKSLDFDEIVPVYLSDEDSTIIGYYIDHRFTTVKKHPTLYDVSHKRYYLDRDCSLVLDMKPIWPGHEEPENDDEGIASIRADYLSKESQE